MAKSKQEKLPGVEDQRDPVLHRKAQEYAEVRDARMDLTRKESEAKQDLIAYMRSKKLEHYECGNIKVDITTSENLKVQIIEGEPDA